MKRSWATELEVEQRCAQERLDKPQKTRRQRMRAFARFMRANGWRWHDHDNDPDTRYR